jgi:hypothetical protein
MDSSLHMHLASLMIQDEIRRASTARLAKQAKQASRPATTVAWCAPRALGHAASGDPSSLRRVY